MNTIETPEIQPPRNLAWF